MSEGDGESERGTDQTADLPAVEKRLSEIQGRKRRTVRWHMSRDTAERAIAAITDGPRAPPTRGKSRRRKKHKRLL
jgi:hypothetical protein